MIPSPETAKAILMRLLEIGVYALVILGAVMVFRRAFKSKARPALRFGLWFLLLLRLTMPFTVTSAVHMIVFPAATAASTPAETRTEASARPVRPSAVVTVSPSPADEPGATTVPAKESHETPSPAVRLSIFQIILMAWILGAFALTLRRVWLWGLLTVRLRASVREPDGKDMKEFRELCRRMRVRRTVRLLVADDITSPALTIGFRPKVLLPSSLAGEGREQERRFALIHELTHLKRGDHLVMLWYGALRCVWWFHPALWLMEKPFRLDMESACDAKAVVGMSREEKLSYAALLLKLSGNMTL